MRDIDLNVIAVPPLRAPPATEVPTSVHHIATRRRKEVAKSSRAGASRTLQSVCRWKTASHRLKPPPRRAALSDRIAS
jgi:hypothetical protein